MSVLWNCLDTDRCDLAEYKRPISRWRDYVPSFSKIGDQDDELCRPWVRLTGGTGGQMTSMETRSGVGTFTVISRWDRVGGVRSRAVETFESWELARGYGLRLACQQGIL